MSDFCKYLSNHHRFEYDEYAPCCWINKKVNYTDPIKLKEYREWLDNITDWVPECNICQYRESVGIESPRQKSLIKYPDMFTGDLTNDDPVTYEFQINEICNSACLSCSAHNSTTWMKYNNSIPIKDRSSIDINISTKTTHRFNIIKENFDFSNVSKITFLGGEPLKTNTHLEILSEITKHNDPKNIALTYTTNGSCAISDEILDIWKTFSRVMVSHSIDGIEEHFEYLRWPLNWNQFNNNLENLVKKKSPNINIGFNIVISPFNIYYMDRYIEYTKGYGEINLLPSIGKINNQSIPNSLKIKMMEKYKDNPEIVKYVFPFNISKYVTFMQYIDKHDKKRNTNWKDVFPEIVEYFDISIPDTVSS